MASQVGGWLCGSVESRVAGLVKGWVGAVLGRRCGWVVTPLIMASSYTRRKILLLLYPELCWAAPRPGAMESERWQTRTHEQRRKYVLEQTFNNLYVNSPMQGGQALLGLFR